MTLRTSTGTQTSKALTQPRSQGWSARRIGDT